MKYNTLRIIRQLMEHELVVARDRRYEMECALKDFDAQDWK